MPEDPLDMLNQAIDRARRLVSELEARQAEVEGNPPQIPAEQLAMGRRAMTNAIAAARRTLEALEDAWQIAVRDLARSAEADEDEIEQTEDERDDETDQ